MEVKENGKSPRTVSGRLGSCDSGSDFARGGARGTSGGSIPKQLSALQPHKIVEDGNVKVALFKDKFA
jgi:hypothetical protein